MPLRFPRACRAAASCVAAMLAAVAPLDAQKNFRPYQSPVKDQGARSTCTAFALVAALETFPGVPSRLSEQYLYAFMKKTQYDASFATQDPLWQRLADFANIKLTTVTKGDLLSRYIALFQRFGIPHEEFMPYQGGALKYDPHQPEAFKLLFEGRVTPADLERVGGYGKYGLAAAVDALTGQQAQDVDAIKRWLDRSGAIAVPVSYLIHAPSWQHYTSGFLPTVMTPDDMVNITDGTRRWTYADARRTVPTLDADLLAGRLRAVASHPDAEYGGHAVTIVGYTQDAFIVKNSWGTAWGDLGYGYVGFDYHRLFALEALRIGQVRYRGPKPSPCVFSVDLRLADLRLKAQPLERDGQKYLLLSTYSMEVQDPRVEQVTYDVFRKGKQLLRAAGERSTDDISFRCEVALGAAVDLLETFDIDAEYSLAVRGDPERGVQDRIETRTSHFKNVCWAVADHRAR
jgi:hypothetical protein